MGKKHHNKSIIPKKKASAAPQPDEYSQMSMEDFNGWKLEGDRAHVIASIKFIQHDFQCFSDWSKQDMKTFWNFINKLHKYNWKNLLATGGKVAKTDLAPTVIPIYKYPDNRFRRSIQNLVEMFELRVDNTKRVHGFRDGPVFFICWLDKNHRICA